MQRSLTFHSFPRNSERQVQAWRQAERGGFFNKIETDRDRGRCLLWWLLLFKGALRQVLSPHCVLSLESQCCSNPCVCVCVRGCLLMPWQGVPALIILSSALTSSPDPLLFRVASGAHTPTVPFDHRTDTIKGKQKLLPALNRSPTSILSIEPSLFHLRCMYF